MKVRAAVLRKMGASMPYSRSRPLSIETIDLEGPGSGEVLVRVAAAGLCHSDLSVIDGSRPRPMPMVLGHEAAGIVEKLGSDVSDLQVGDHVVMVFMPSCGHCAPCAEGRPALCEPGAAANGKGALLGGHLRLSAEENGIHHHLGVSAFAERVVVSRCSIVKIDKDLPLTEAALFGCAVLTGAGAVVNNARLRPGTQAVVVGLGGVGLAAVMGARAAGASKVIAVDLAHDKLALAQEAGATHVIHGGLGDPVEQVIGITGGGADYAFEFAGSIRALEDAVSMTRRGGMTVTASLPPIGAALPVDVAKLVAEERMIKGSYIGTCVPVRDIPRFIELYRSGRLPVDKLLGRVIGLDEINDGFDMMHGGQVGRQVVRFF